MMIESIVRVDIIIIEEIELAHILTPTYDLPHQSFLRSKGHIMSEDSLDHFHGMKESKIHCRGKIRMMNKYIILIHSIFEPPKITGVILQKVSKK
jgi:hypothetical protein